MFDFIKKHITKKAKTLDDFIGEVKQQKPEQITIEVDKSYRVDSYELFREFLSRTDTVTFYFEKDKRKTKYVESYFYGEQQELVQEKKLDLFTLVRVDPSITKLKSRLPNIKIKTIYKNEELNEADYKNLIEKANNTDLISALN